MSMGAYKKITVAGCLFAYTIAGVGLTRNFDDDDDLTRDNLKVIPKNISKKNLQILMTRYTREIGVSCEYCHTTAKPKNRPEYVDFASDEKPEKKIAREMMKMTNRINKKYFAVKNTYNLFLKLPVTCSTCHRGISRPNKLRLYPNSSVGEGPK